MSLEGYSFLGLNRDPKDKDAGYSAMYCQIYQLVRTDAILNRVPKVPTALQV